MLNSSLYSGGNRARDGKSVESCPGVLCSWNWRVSGNTGKGRVWGGKSKEECQQDITLYCLESLVSGPWVLEATQGSKAGALLGDISLIQPIPKIILCVPLLPSRQIPLHPHFHGISPYFIRSTEKEMHQLPQFLDLEINPSMMTKY